MKLRRAMVTAAATAAIAPLALLSAPAAFAETTPSAPATETTVTESPTSPAPESSAATTPAGGESTTSTTSTTAPAGKEPQSKASSSTGTSATPGDSTSPTSEPSPWPSGCPTDDNGVDPESALSLDVSGLPGKIVAGSGWHNFTLTAANHSDKDLGEVRWLAMIDNYSESDNEKDWLSTYAQLEYLNPKSGQWESLADEVGNGLYFGETSLGAKKTVAIKLRVNIGAKAPAGDGYTIGLGGYVDEEKECVHSAVSFFEFTVLKPGSNNDNPGDAKPGKGQKPASGKQPQGGASEIPATGSLASTGSSSALPTIALVGGLAVVTGGGAMFVVRRRRTGGQAA